MNKENEADKIFERLSKTPDEIRMDEITSILDNTSPSEFSHLSIQLLIDEWYNLKEKNE